MQLHVNHPEYAFHTFRILKTNQRHDLVLVKADGYIAGKVVDTEGSPIEKVSVTVEPQEDYTTGQLLHAVYTNTQGAFELRHINDPFVSISVRTDQDYKGFDHIAVNQHDLVLTLTPNEPRPELVPEQQAQQKAQWSYYEAAHERFKTLVDQPAPDLAVAEWLFRSARIHRTVERKDDYRVFLGFKLRRRSCRMGTAIESLAGGVWRKRNRLPCHLSGCRKEREGQTAHRGTIAFLLSRLRPLNSSRRCERRDIRSIRHRALSVHPD